MAFFGATELGYQNLIKERTIPDFREGTAIGNLKYQTNGTLQRKCQSSIALQGGRFPAASCCPGVTCDRNIDGKNDESASICPQVFPPILPKSGLPPNSEKVYDHGNSYKKLMDLRYRHVRTAKEPVEVYRYPVLTSHEIGRWRNRETLDHCEPWTKGPRFIYTESEMTKFVNKMALSNREFSLF